MAIGSHTWSHRNLAQLSAARRRGTICRRSSEVLEERLGEPVRAIAYPWGKLGRHVNAETFAAARRAGYRARPDLAAARVRDVRRPAARRAPRRGRRPGGAPGRQGHRRHRLARLRARAHPRSGGPPALRRGCRRLASGSQRGRPAGAPPVDAIITCHNYGRFLGEAIESVLAQNHPNLTVVVVDDGSTDDTAAVAAALRGARRPLRPPHRRAAPARRATPACEATSSPLVAFLDADDAWLPHRVAAGRGAPRAPPRRRAGGRPRVRLRRGDAPVQRRPRAARPGLRAACFEELLIHNVVLNPSSVLRPALRARGGRRVQRDPHRAGLGHLARDRQALPDRVRRRGGGARPAPHERHHAAQGAGSHRHSSSRSSTATWAPSGPAWKRPLLRRGAASAACLHAGLGSAIQGHKAGRPALRRSRRSRSTPSPSPAASSRCWPGCSSRSRWWRGSSHALRDDARLAREHTGHAVVKPDA